MAKLTLSVDERVITRVKLYAKAKGVSVSAMVETYLSAIAERASPVVGPTPVLDSVRGILKSADPGEYKKHLSAKYR